VTEVLTQATGLVRAALARITATEERIQAFAAVFADEALAAAQEQDDSDEPAGALTGIPLVVKDIYDVGGYRTGNGSLGAPEHVAAVDAEAVRRLRAAGAIVVAEMPVSADEPRNCGQALAGAAPVICCCCAASDGTVCRPSPTEEEQTRVASRNATNDFISPQSAPDSHRCRRRAAAATG